MGVLKKLVMGAVFLAMTGIAEGMQRSGGGSPPVMVPPTRGRGGAPPSGMPGARRGGGPPPASATASRIERKTYTFKETNQKLEYALFVSSRVDKKKESPLVIALHGLNVPPVAMMRQLSDAAELGGYIVAAPTGYALNGWYGANGATSPETTPQNLGELSEKDVMNVLDLMRKEFKIDERRIYLMGQSMGGGGALYLGVKHREVWAAVAATAPAIPKQSPGDLESVKDLPVMLVHGSADEAVPVEQSRRWVDKMRALNMTHEYLELPGGVHGDALAVGAPFVFLFFDKHVKAPKGP